MLLMNYLENEETSEENNKSEEEMPELDQIEMDAVAVRPKEIHRFQKDIGTEKKIRCL